MADALRAILVGCGSLSQRGILPHLAQPDARECIQLVAVVDVVAERARACAERFGVLSAFSTLDEALATTAADLVIVTTPVQHHFALALAAINAGKHVYVQKTMTATLAEADELLAARDRAGVKLAAAPGYELCTTTAAMREAVASGELGRVYNAFSFTWGYITHRDPRPGVRDPLAEIDPTWNFQRGGGGPLPNVTVYGLQLATSVLGPVRRVTALANRLVTERTWAGRSLPVEIEDNNLLVLEFASGTIGTAVGSNGRGTAWTPWGGLSLHGDRAALQVTEVHHASGYPLRFEVQGGGKRREYATALSDQPYLRGEHLRLEEPHVYADIMDLADAVREDRPPRATGEQARHVVEIIEQAQLAARTGQTQAIHSTF